MVKKYKKVHMKVVQWIYNVQPYCCWCNYLNINFLYTTFLEKFKGRLFTNMSDHSDFVHEVALLAGLHMCQNSHAAGT